MGFNGKLRWLAACAALGLLSCRGEALSGTTGALEVSPQEIVFGPTWLGERSRAPLELRNTGRAPLEVELEAAAPFFVEPRLRLAGGEARLVDVLVTSTSPGRLQGLLVARAGEARHEVSLRADVATAPTCPQRDCHEVTFDTRTGACVERVLPDDAACGAGNQCLLDGRCRAGACVGRARDCDDGDACTTDACDAATGCLHQDATASCAAPADPCLAARCEPLTGCAAAPVADGTACGENDCATAHVCIAGACVVRAAPEGSACAAATSCQGPGRCREGDCVLPPLTPMTPRWVYQPAPGRTFTFHGHVDDDGNAYATEHWVQPDHEVDVALTELVSLNRDGVVRFRQLVASDCASCRWGLWFAVDSPGRRLFFNAQLKTQARSLEDGRLLWTREVTTGIALRDVRPDGGGSFGISAPLLVGDDLVGVPLFEGVNDHHAYVRTFDRATGTPGWTLHKKGHLYGTGVASTGELWTSSANCWAPAGELTRVAPSGAALATRFVALLPATTYGPAFGLGSTGGKLVRFDEQFATVDLTAAIGAQPSATGLVAGTELVLWDRGVLRVVDTRTDALLRTATPTWVGQAPDFELLRDGGVAWTGTLADAGVLGAVDGRGAPLLTCVLPTPPGNPTTILKGQALVAGGGGLAAYAVPGLDVAPEGWVAKGGSLGRGGRGR